MQSTTHALKTRNRVHYGFVDQTVIWVRYFRFENNTISSDGISGHIFVVPTTGESLGAVRRRDEVSFGFSSIKMTFILPFPGLLDYLSVFWKPASGVYNKVLSLPVRCLLFPEGLDHVPSASTHIVQLGVSSLSLVICFKSTQKSGVLLHRRFWQRPCLLSTAYDWSVVIWNFFGRNGEVFKLSLSSDTDWNLDSLFAWRLAQIFRPAL